MGALVDLNLIAWDRMPLILRSPAPISQTDGGLSIDLTRQPLLTRKPMIDRLTSWGEYRRNHTQALKADAQRIERVFKSLDPFDQAILVNRFVIPLTFRRLTAEQVADITADVIRDFTADRQARSNGTTADRP